MAARDMSVALGRGAFVALPMAAQVGTAQVADFVGRVVDAVEAKVLAGAHVRLRGGTHPNPSAQTDAQGFFRISNLPAGSHLVDVSMPDGRAFLPRLVMLPGRKTQFVELDYARAVPPDDDEDYWPHLPRVAVGVMTMT
jgi:hypothetical protein